MGRFIVQVVNTGYAGYEIESSILVELDAEVRVAAVDCRTEDQVIETAADADALLIREAPISARVIDALPRCKAIVRYGVGVDNIDLDAAKSRKIYVCNVPDYCEEEVSDHAVTLMLACCRNLITRNRNLRRGVFESDVVDQIDRISGRTLGLVGYGKIAQAVHRKWAGFLPDRVLVCDPYLPAELAEAKKVHAVELKTLLQQSDFISLHAPLTAETHHLISATTLDWMKPSAILVNTARGGLINEADLVNALREGRLRGAGLDVFEYEPIGKSHPLTQLPNVVLTSHVAWYSLEAVKTLQTSAAQEVHRVLSGREPMNWVNKWI